MLVEAVFVTCCSYDHMLQVAKAVNSINNGLPQFYVAVVSEDAWRNLHPESQVCIFLEVRTIKSTL
jgi:hypothetical protein